MSTLAFISAFLKLFRIDRDTLEPIEKDFKLLSTFSNDSKSKNFATFISGILEAELNRIRAGDLGKSGPGPRAKVDSARNVRKTGGGSLFAQSFTPQRQSCSQLSNKPLSCRNNGKIKENKFNRNQNPGGASSSMETMSKRLSQEYKVCSGMSPTLSKISKKVRKDEDTRKGLDTLKE